MHSPLHNKTWQTHRALAAPKLSNWLHRLLLLLLFRMRRSLEYGTWGGDIRPGFEPKPGETVATEHWCSSGFARDPFTGNRWRTPRAPYEPNCVDRAGSPRQFHGEQDVASLQPSDSGPNSRCKESKTRSFILLHSTGYPSSETSLVRTRSGRPSGIRQPPANRRIGTPLRNRGEKCAG
jgi:hypothetical protein